MFVYRSAEQGLTLINDLNNMKTRKSLAEHMSTKHELILKKFIAEIGIVEHEFLVSSKSTTNQKHLTDLSACVQL